VSELPATEIRTPEGLELSFRTAAASERATALVIDLLVILALLIVVFLVAMLLGLVGGGWLFFLLAFFLLRQGYFFWCETRGRGTTFGKRRLHLKVVRADGGPLSLETLLARNLTREIEFFVPLIVLLYPDALFAGHTGWTRLLATLWVLLPMFFPLFHPHRLRIGDLLAGTRVVVAPPVEMLRDLADRSGKAKAEAAPVYTFTPPQLEIYGERELKVLEELLRKARSEGGREGLVAATRSIARKIGYGDARQLRGKERDFLQAFYRAQREHLEQRLLLGKRRLHKRGAKPAE